MSETTDFKDPVAIERHIEQEMQWYLDGLAEKGVKPHIILVHALKMRISEQVLDARVEASEEVRESVDVLPEPAPGRSMWQEVWSWRGWVLKAAMAAIWIWFSWFFFAMIWRPGLVVIGAAAVILCLASAIRDVVEGYRA